MQNHLSHLKGELNNYEISYPHNTRIVHLFKPFLEASEPVLKETLLMSANIEKLYEQVEIIKLNFLILFLDKRTFWNKTRSFEEAE